MKAGLNTRRRSMLNGRMPKKPIRHAREKQRNLKSASRNLEKIAWSRRDGAPNSLCPTVKTKRMLPTHPSYAVLRKSTEEAKKEASARLQLRALRVKAAAMSLSRICLKDVRDQVEPLRCLNSPLGNPLSNSLMIALKIFPTLRMTQLTALKETATTRICASVEEKGRLEKKLRRSE